MSDKRQKGEDGVSIKLGGGGMLEATGASGENEITHALSGMSAESKNRADELIKQLEAKRRARTMAVPTNDFEVRKRLRQLGEPITYFGEGPANRRERLRNLLAELAVEAASGVKNERTAKLEEIVKGESDVSFGVSGRITTEAYDTDGSPALLNARVEIYQFSIPRARSRLLAAKRKRANITKQIMEDLDKAYAEKAKALKGFTNSTSQIGGGRPISACDFRYDSKRLATASWSGVCKVWSVPDSNLLCQLKGHTDRVSDIRYHPHAGVTMGASLAMATAGVDGTLRFWSLSDIEKAASEAQGEADMKVEGESTTSASQPQEKKVKSIKASSILKGHEDRLSRIAFHPSGQYIASTSYDTTWRLWDLSLQKELLCQDGHAAGTYGLAFNPDGAVMCTGDIGGICRVWDLRSGKPVASLDGHVDNILCIDFSSNGHELATGSCDNTLKIWDLRKRKSSYTILAHSKLISNVCYHPNEPDFLVSSSYDNTVKIWSARDYQLLKTLKGHEGRVMRAQISHDGNMIASTSFDRTWKLWMADEDS